MDTSDLFNAIAAHYDRWSNLLSGEGIRAWHRFAVAHMHLVPGLKVLDVGCGTGTATYLMARAVGPKGTVVGLDPAIAMLTVAKNTVKDAGSAPIDWVLGNGEHLPFLDQAFDRVTAQFSLRNMTHWTQGLQEMVRVLKDDGQLTILEMVQPTTTTGTLAWRSLETITASLSLPALIPYQWLGVSLRHAPTTEEFRVALGRLGITDLTTHHWLGGLVAVIHGVKGRTSGGSVQGSPPPTVLWALDGSVTSLNGAHWINAFIGAGTIVHIVTVVPPSNHREPICDTDQAFWHQRQHTAETLLEERKFRVEAHLVEGHPGRTLIALARATESRLIIVGNPHRSALADRLIGGGARYVFAHAEIPVVVIPPDIDRQ